MEKLPAGTRVEWDIKPKPNYFFWAVIAVGLAALIFAPRRKESAAEPLETAQMAIIELPELQLPKADDAVRRYILRFQKVAIAEQGKFGIPASIKMAQGILESGAGTSDLVRKSNNHFGVKCFAKGCRHRECVNKCDDSCRDYFVKYETAWLSWRAHSLLLSNPDYRYASMIGSCSDYKCWANGLQRKGYATSKTYAKKLISIIEKYDLRQLDNGRIFAGS